MRQVSALPRFYLITPDFSGNKNLYLSELEESLKNGVKLVQLRSKNLSLQEYLKLENDLLPIIRSFGAKLILNNSESLLSASSADGIHFPSKEYANLKKRPISHKYLFSVACHNKEQIKHAENIDADFGVLCPVFSTPSSPTGTPIGWDEFSKIAKLVKFPIYALGGLNIQDLVTAKENGAYGLAAKRALWNLKEQLPS